MAYIVPTVAAFKTRYPAFAAVADDVVQSAIDEALLEVSECWIERDYPVAIMLYAAHILTLNGYGTGAEAEAAAQGMLGFTRVKSRSFEWQRNVAQSNGAPDSDDAWYSLTLYGQRFLQMLRRSFPAIRVV
jgi:hypothetical protein